MDIETNSNISNMIANSISKLNLNTATRAFEAAKKEPTNDEIKLEDDFKQEDIKLAQDTISTKQIDVDDIQKYANSMGENLSIDDINYGLMYGRSVIADYSA